jgi:serine/threonine protein phosphatase PrpC
VITRAVGVEPLLNVDVTLFATQLGDAYLLCSDGLYNAVSSEEITAALAIRDVKQSSDRLLEKALENGAKDNVSIIVVRGNPGPVASAKDKQS